MSRITIFVAFSLLVSLFAQSSSASVVDGWAYLDGESTHCEIAVRCTDCGPLHSTLYTDVSGYFGEWIAIGGGQYHTFEYSYPGFETDSQTVWIPLLSNVTLPPLTLFRGIKGNISGELRPGIYRVTGNASIPSSQVLTVQPGTEFRFTGPYSLDVHGTLNAIGTADRPIVFTLNFWYTQKWQGIHFDVGSSSSTIGYCIVEKTGNGASSALSCSGASPTIAHCMFKENTVVVAVLELHSSDLTLDTSVIADNTGAGISFSGSTDATIRNCTIVDNTGAGLSCPLSEFPTWHMSAINSIVYQNGGLEVIPAAFSPAYCDIEGGWPGTGNVDCPPELNSCYAPTHSTCCTDAGDPVFAYDLDGTRGDIGYQFYFQNDGAHCQYLTRCGGRWREDFFSSWSNWCKDPNEEHNEFISGVRDGEGSATLQWFLLHMEGRIYLPPPKYIIVYEFGTIVGLDKSTGQTVTTIRLPDNSDDYAGLALDDRDGSFWVSTLKSTDLLHFSSSGSLIGSFSLARDSVAGMAFDARQSHLWCFRRGSPDEIYEYDVSAGTPTLVRGPLTIGTHRQAAGLDCHEEYGNLIASTFTGRELAVIRVPFGQELSVTDTCPLYPLSTNDPWGLALDKDARSVVLASSSLSGPFTFDKYLVPGDTLTVCDCMPGDADGSDTVDISDAVYLVRYIFIPGSPKPTPYGLCSGDANCDCDVDISDIVFLIQYIFVPGSPPPCSCEQWVSNCGLPLRK